MRIDRKTTLTAALLVLGWAAVSVDGGPGVRAASTSGQVSDTHVFDEVAPGVYFAAGTGALNVAGNAMVVVNEEDVVVVDSHITPDAARALIQSVKAVSAKPIRYLINSHFHFDHAHGNQAFPEGVEIIGHEYTRERLLGNVLDEPTYRVIGSPPAQRKIIAALESQLDGATGKARESLQLRIAALERHVKALGEVRPTPPTITLKRKMTLFRGSREIRILHLGRAHTGGDVVVYLPAEKILFTGDLFYDGPPYLGDSFPEEFVAALERLKAIEFETIVPGHGPLVRDPRKIGVRQDYIRRYRSEVSALRKQGLSAEEAAARLSFAGFGHYPGLESRNRGTVGLEIRRIYQELEGKRVSSR